MLYHVVSTIIEFIRVVIKKVANPASDPKQRKHAQAIGALLDLASK
jgi:hypothetical protein